jgi:large subunit ribosomal protein L24e
MVTQYTCSFCGVAFPKGKGMLYVKNDGSVLYFCSSKCRKNMLILKRKPEKYKWTTYYVKQKLTLSTTKVERFSVR